MFFSLKMTVQKEIQSNKLEVIPWYICESDTEGLSALRAYSYQMKMITVRQAKWTQFAQNRANAWFLLIMFVSNLLLLLVIGGKCVAVFFSPIFFDTVFLQISTEGHICSHTFCL